jgi:hypothetical protein
MAESDADKQPDDRERTAETGAAPGEENAHLRAELRSTLEQLRGLQVEIERLASCKHPSGSAAGRVCQECGAEVW